MAASSTNYAAEVASIQGLDVQTVREDIREGGKLIEAVGVDKALEISRSKLGTRDGIGGHALRDCSGGEVVAV